MALSVKGGGSKTESPSRKKKSRKRGLKGSARQTARYRTAQGMSKLTYEETTEMIRSRERSYEDPNLKEVEEMVDEMAEHL